MNARRRELLADLAWTLLVLDNGFGLVTLCLKMQRDVWWQGANSVRSPGAEAPLLFLFFQFFFLNFFIPSPSFPLSSPPLFSTWLLYFCCDSECYCPTQGDRSCLGQACQFVELVCLGLGSSIAVNCCKHLFADSNGYQWYLKRGSPLPDLSCCHCSISHTVCLWRQRLSFSHG